MNAESPAALAINLARALAVPCELLEELRELHMRQWMLEDRARASGSAESIAAAKADIDASNARRHVLINVIDTHAKVSGSAEPCCYYPETVGELCDRLLILELKRQALADLSWPSDDDVQSRRRVEETCRHLYSVVDQLLADVSAGRAALPPRVGVKIYNGVSAAAASSVSTGGPT